MLDALGLEALDEDVRRFAWRSRGPGYSGGDVASPEVVETRYTLSGGLHIAWQEAGSAERDLLYVPTWIWQIEVLVSEPRSTPSSSACARSLGSITFDRRGSGLSDPIAGAPTLEEQMDDVLAVMDAAGSERARLMGSLEGGLLAMAFAASHPERVEPLVLYATFLAHAWAPDYDWAPQGRRAQRADRAERRPVGPGRRAARPGAEPGRTIPPSATGRPDRALLGQPGHDPPDHASGSGRPTCATCCPPSACPPWSCTGARTRSSTVEHSRYLAEHIPGARYVELEGAEGLFSEGDSEAILGEIEEFLTGSRHEREPDRVLATVLFTDIVDSTGHAATLGRLRLAVAAGAPRQLARRQVERHRGRYVKSTGDGMLATFDGPARAIRAAEAIEAGVRRAGHRDPLGIAHGRVRGDARRRGRHRRAHRRPGHGRGQGRRGARVEHGEGPGGGLGDRLRGARDPRAARASPASGACSRPTEPSGRTATLGPFGGSILLAAQRPRPCAASSSYSQPWPSRSPCPPGRARPR